ncbi:AI-2E family transporter [Bacteroides sp. 214]|uniref:AI-2E family transporter n=1 Tax=Bacteroides sp. 214 TaxID=2302935 RepID=UPI0013D6D6D0|nr:AI-2E family transporter [Bacteroides sp. 214]NDW12265.1 AI-2E family transporter [Bacteroides sp. 214]
MLEKKITFDSFIRSIIGLVIAICILGLINHLSGVLLPFFLAWLIAYLVYPIVRFFQNKLRIRNRAVAIFCTLFLLIGIGFAIFYIIIPPMVGEISKVKDLLVAYFTTNSANDGAIPESLSEFLRKNIDFNAINEALKYENITAILKSAVPKIWLLLSESISFLFSIFTIFIILLYIIFILLDYETFNNGWPKLVPEKYRGFVQELASDIETGMNRYFRGQALVAFCVGILFCIGFLIIDFPMAIALGLFIGALNLVPYLQTLGFLPTIMLAILKAADTGQNFWLIILSAAIVFIVVQIIQDGFIVPKIMGKVTGLNPALILLSLSVWGALMGFIGLIIALPLTTLMLSYYQRYIINHEDIYYRNKQEPENQEEKEFEEK